MKRIRKYWLVAATSLQSNLAYSSSFLFGIVFYAFLIFIFTQLWGTIFGNGRTISGYSRDQMIWYCIITEMVMLSGSGIFQDLNTDIKGGNIAYLLNKPYNYIMYQFSNCMGLSAVKLVLNAMIGILIGLLFIGGLKSFNAVYLPFMVLSILLGIVLNFFLQATIGLTAFWLEENTAFFWVYQKLVLILGTFLPVEFFPKWVQNITLSLPFSYVTYGPAKLFVDFSPEKCLNIILMQSLYLILIVLACFIVYRKGVKVLNVNGG